MFATYTRLLLHRLPLIRGPDVQLVQERLYELGFSIEQINGLYERTTETAVRDFQSSRGLRVDGIVGPRTWSALFEAETGRARLKRLLPELTTPHAFRNSVEWALSPEGVLIGDSDSPEVWGGPPATVRRVWTDYGDPIRTWGREFGVPVELIVSTICTETKGQNDLPPRKEDGYVSDEETPDEISVGLMQTLISTARSTLEDSDIDREWLLEPSNSIRAGTAYIAQQWKETHLDPPKVACAYNAGGIYHNDSPDNRWRMRQYPINKSKHADRFVKWFNECFLMFDEDGGAPPNSFYAHLPVASDGADEEESE